MEVHPYHTRLINLIELQIPDPILVYLPEYDQDKKLIYVNSYRNALYQLSMLRSAAQVYKAAKI